jgi:hypothetical protein
LPQSRLCLNRVAEVLWFAFTAFENSVRNVVFWGRKHALRIAKRSERRCGNRKVACTARVVSPQHFSQALLEPHQTAICFLQVKFCLIQGLRLGFAACAIRSIRKRHCDEQLAQYRQMFIGQLTQPHVVRQPSVSIFANTPNADQSAHQSHRTQIHRMHE